MKTFTFYRDTDDGSVRLELPVEATDVTDGYHTMHELYQHRLALTVALTRAVLRDDHGYANAWRSKQHSDDSMFPGYFIVGITNHEGQHITYHYDLKHWDLFEHCATYDRAPEWDGHTPEDTIIRLLEL